MVQIWTRGGSSSECTVSQELLWLCEGESSSGTQEGECPPCEACTRGSVSDNRPRGLNALVVDCRL
jgi:hypothetical protein